MKKKYIAPNILTAQTETEGMIATSTLTIVETTAVVDVTEAEYNDTFNARKRHDQWDDGEEDF